MNMCKTKANIVIYRSKHSQSIGFWLCARSFKTITNHDRFSDNIPIMVKLSRHQSTKSENMQDCASAYLEPLQKNIKYILIKYKLYIFKYI